MQQSFRLLDESMTALKLRPTGIASIASALLMAAASARSTAQSATQTVDWPAYNGSLDGDHFSKLKQIDRSNVSKLKLAWRFDPDEPGGVFAGVQDNPLIVGRTLYAYTPTQKIIALDATTGTLKWEFDSGVVGSQPARGMAWWSEGSEHRLLAGVMNFLYCLDPETGKPIAAFGENGRIDLRKDLRGNYEEQSIALTSPGVVYKNLIIVGGRNPETHPAPPGDIRAFDVRTGKLVWSFHTIPRPGEPGYETWPKDAWKTAGAANNWAGMTLDRERGILYAPTGSAVFDFYGGDRAGNDLYANCILAIDAATGKLLWHFQGVHHDIWDRDFPSPPALLTLRRNGKDIPAIAQTSKQGYVYVFNRLTGEPLFPISEKPYPKSTIPGEVTSPTQPLPDAPPPYARQQVTEDGLSNRTPEVHEWALKAFHDAHSGGQFLPFALDKPTILLPGFDGGAEWGGPAIDPATNILYVNENEMAWLAELTEAKQTGSVGGQVYESQCAVCHGVDLKGSPPAFPSLLNVLQRLSVHQVVDTVRGGKGRMPAFPNLDEEHLNAVIDYLRYGPPADVKDRAAAGNSGNKELASAASQEALPDKYVFMGYHRFIDLDGYPAIAPPWGTLNAIDLNTGKFVWKIPLGEYPELVKQGMKNTGSETYGGPIVTAGGLLFIGSTVADRKFRAFDVRDGKLLWETELPFSGVATPSTYMIDGRQYIVIAASGGRDPRSPAGGAYVAFALPQ
jgi:quinoprotein glucose dehydrogenase